jgi:hypothetical protein
MSCFGYTFWWVSSCAQTTTVAGVPLTEKRLANCRPRTAGRRTHLPRPRQVAEKVGCAEQPVGGARAGDHALAGHTREQTGRAPPPGTLGRAAGGQT